MVDVLRQTVQTEVVLDIASPTLSLFAFFELRDLLSRTERSRIILPINSNSNLALLGSPADRAARNRLQVCWFARDCAKWIREKTDVRTSMVPLPQSVYFVRHPHVPGSRIITGNCPLSTEGLGFVPGNQLSLIQCAETPEEAKLFSAWYESLWNTISDGSILRCMRPRGTCSLTSRMPMMRSTARKFEVMKDTSAKWTVRRAGSTFCV